MNVDAEVRRRYRTEGWRARLHLARVEGLTLVTADPLLSRYDVPILAAG